MQSARAQTFQQLLAFLLTSYNNDNLPQSLQAVADIVGSYGIPPPLTSMPGHHNVDSTSLSLLPDDAPPGMIPLSCRSDGNCLFNAASILLSGDDHMATELRVRTAIALSQLHQQFTNTSSQPVRQLIHEQCLLYSQSGSTACTVQKNVIDNAEIEMVFQNELQNTLTDRAWSSMWQMVGLATALQMPILSVYPKYNARIRDSFNTLVNPLISGTDQTFVLPIFWTGFVDNGNFTPNHFVPLVPRTFLHPVISTVQTCLQKHPHTSTSFSSSKLLQVAAYCSQHTLTNYVSSTANVLSPCAGSSTMLTCMPQASLTTVTTPRVLPKPNVSTPATLMANTFANIHNTQLTNSTDTIMATQTVSCSVAIHTNGCSSLFLQKMTKADTFCGSCLKRIVAKIAHATGAYTQTCAFCCRYIKQNLKSPTHTDYMNPGAMPPSLSCLNSTETKLISQVHPYMNMVFLPSGGQHGLKGQSINIPIPIQSLCNSLPRSLDPTAQVKIYSVSSKSFFQFVHLSRINLALQWLKENNELYSAIHISPLERPLGSADDKMETDEADCDIQEFGLVPHDFQLKSPADVQSCPTFTLPRISSTPVNIFDSPTLEVLAFPTLYPYGIHGLHDRQEKLSFSQYFQCRILNKDVRWSQSAPYLFWALHIHEQHHLQSAITTVLRTRTNTDESIQLEDVTNTQTLNIKTDNYSFMRKMRGTAAFWKNELTKLMAKIRTLGPPTFFLSLSANDMHWHDLFHFISPVITENDIISLSYTDRCQLVRDNPVLCAIHFRNRWESFLNNYLLKKPYPIGYITDYFARVEFQARGSPHLHILLWIADAPSLEDRNSPFLIPFIDAHISARLPDASIPIMRRLVQSLQQHTHTHACARPNRKTCCRFDFPAPVASETRLKILTDTGSPARFYLLKRNADDLWTNPYNADILQTWNANMDIQLVGSMYQVARYICTYICKNEPFSFKQKIQMTLKQLPMDSSQRKILSKLGNILLTHRTISTQETAYRLLGLHMVYSSRDTIFIDTYLPDKRYRMLKPKKQLDELTPGSTDIYVDGLRQYYLHRPNNELFNTMTLAHFVTNYKVGQPIVRKDIRSCLPRYELLVGARKVVIMSRSKAACLRCFIPQIAVDAEAHYFSLLSLFMPYRNETEIIAPYDTFQEAFQNKQHSLDQEELQKTKLMGLFEKTVQHLLNLQREVIDDIQCIATPSYQQAKDVTSAEDPQPLFQPFTFDILQPSDVPKKTDTLDYNIQMFKNLSVYTMTDDEFVENLALLNLDQRKVLETINKHNSVDPLYLFVTGGAGTGKSFLLRTLREHLLRMNTKTFPNVVVAAPTGVAAFNIGGFTLHSLLQLPTQHKSNAPYRLLSPRSLKVLRESFHNVSYLIIDEISMVSYNTLEHIHLRLNEIKSGLLDSNQLFGGINIITFGDLYQLRPVFGSAIFTEQRPAPLVHLWKDQFQMIELVQNERQSKDSAYAQLLNRIRVGQHTENDIDVLKDRLLPSNHSSQHYLHIFPLKSDRDLHNTDRLTATISATNTHIINAIHDAPASSIPSDDQKCAGIPCQTILGVGARVMLVRNIHTDQGLVNGAQGTVTSFEWSQQQGKLSRTEMPSCVNVIFDDPNVLFGVGNVREPIGIVPITVQFLGNDHRYVTRTQIPLVLAFATTVHKVQGLTLKNAVVDIGSTIFSPGMAYVALSRVSCLKDLFLLKLCTPRIYPSSNVHDEMDRLREFTQNSSS